MTADSADWLALNRMPGRGRAVLCALAEGRVSPGEAVARGGGADPAGVAADLAWLAAPGRHLVTLVSARYPRRLREIPDPPPVLFVAGDPAVLDRAQIALVGSRRATPLGVETAEALAAGLAERGLCITSGLALGVDAAGHRGAIAAGGHTVAVAGHGLDRVYPRRHRTLAREVAASGALVSEFPPGTPPLPAHFPRRNRIISGLSLGVVVVEAARRSGSLITARLAGEQGRDVFAVPGPIQSPLTRGCHALIRQGAKLVETVGDILEELPPGSWSGTPPAAGPPLAPPAPPAPIGAPALDPSQIRLLECLAHAPVGIDALVARSGLTAEKVSSILLALELRGLVAPVAGGAFCRTASSPQSE